MCGAGRQMLMRFINKQVSTLAFAAVRPRLTAGPAYYGPFYSLSISIYFIHLDSYKRRIESNKENRKQGVERISTLLQWRYS